MPAKDYKLVVSELGGKAYITKVSKTNPNLMLSDRVALDDGVALQFIEEFAKHRITETKSIMQCKDINGNLIYEVHFPNAASIERKANMNKIAVEIIAQTANMSEEDILRMPGIPTTLISLAKMVQKLTTP